MKSLLNQVLSLIFVLVFSGLGGPTNGWAQNAETIVRSDSVDAVVQVRGMACEMCARNMRQSFEAKDEVQSARVDLEKQHIYLTFANGTKPLSEKALRETVVSAGYEFQKVLPDRENASDSDPSRR